MSNIRLGRRGLPRTNALAYLASSSLRKQKRLMRPALVSNIRLGRRLAKDKRSSLFGLVISEEVEKINEMTTLRSLVSSGPFG